MKRGLMFVLKYELRLWEALFRWAFRRPHRVEPGTVTFSYTGAVAMLFGVFIGLSALEIPILHLILPWPLARTISVVAGAYGLFWMIGLLATLRTHPHLVGPSGLRIRNSTTVDVAIGWDDIDAVRVRRRSLPPGGQTQVEEVGDERVLSLGVGSQTSVDVLLGRPLTVAVRKTGGAPVTQIRFHADDPEALVAAAQAYLPARDEVA
ncbi:MAG TPA: hypothetical protein VH502_05955 [Actinoplanes sp.]|jgi:hypothetical protein